MSKKKQQAAPAPETKAPEPQHEQQAAATAPPQEPVDKTQAEIAALKAEAAALKDQLLRALAETENVRKRAARELEDNNKYATSSFARDLLEVLENLHRAEDNIPKEQLQDPLMKTISDGIKMTKEELLRVFARHGIRRITPLGEMFDHNFHQAVVQLEDANAPAGSVVQVLQSGYVIHDRLLRPAMVAVAKAPEKKE